MSIEEAIRTDEKIKAKRARNKRLAMGIPPKPVGEVENALDALRRAGQDHGATGVQSALVAHNSDPIIRMYDEEGRERMVPEGSVRVCLAEGLYLECPICGDEHEGNDANCCPGRDRVRYRKCPICGKTIYDDRAHEAAIDAADPDLIPTDLPSTAEARTQARLEAHMVAYHEEAARRAGLMTADSARR